VPVSFVTAALGGTVEVPTLGGNVELKVPVETQSGRVFRLREKGVRPVRGGATGDLFCRVVVETPINLTEEQREILRAFDSSMQDSARNHSPRERTWLDGVKRFFDTIRN
jgi:molecular chaperone DnaJ